MRKPTIEGALEHCWGTISQLRHPCNRKPLIFRFMSIANRCQKSSVTYAPGKRIVTRTYCDGSELTLTFPKDKTC